jgi:peptidoglycan/LPS O-acetylase OafA/YrhL
VAVLGVLLFHADLLPGGYLGVDTFFVLSGFLITSLLLVEARATDAIALGAFWARRARRLLPALFLVLLAVGAYATWRAQPTELGTIRGDALATLAYVANWRFVLAHADYWAIFRAPSPLQHTWSLAIEEQFYLVWPIVVLGITAWTRRRERTTAAVARRVFLVAAGLALLGAVWSIALWHLTHDANRVYYGTDTRLPAIALGAAFAAWTRWRGPIGHRRRLVEVGGLAGAVVLGVAWWTLENGERLYDGGLLLCSVAALAVIAAATALPDGVVARLLRLRPLVALGVISYGVYLWHWPVYVVLDPAHTGLNRTPLFLVRLTVTLVLATASFVLVEQPIRRGRFPRPLRVLTPAAAGGLVAVLLVATAGAVAPGPPAPTTPSAAMLRQRAARAERLHALRVLVVGNSVASSLAEDGFSQLVTRPATEVVDDGIFSCDFPPSRLVQDAHEARPQKPFDCTAPWRTAVRVFRPDLAVLVLGDVHQQEYLLGGRWLSECDPGFAPRFDHALGNAVEVLQSRGARVVLTTAAYSIFLGGERSIAPVRARTKCANALIRRFAARRPDVALVDLQRYVCPRGNWCRATLAGAPVRPDGVHYRGMGARLVAGWLYEQLGIDAPTSSPRAPSLRS